MSDEELQEYIDHASPVKNCKNPFHLKMARELLAWRKAYPRVEIKGGIAVMPDAMMEFTKPPYFPQTHSEDEP